MPGSPWFPDAHRVPSHRANPMAHNNHAKKLCMHTSEGDASQSAVSLAQYTVNEAKEYSAVINSQTGEIAQIYPINTGARSAENGGVDGGVGCNRSGEIMFQVCIAGHTADGEHLIKEALKHDKVVKFFQWIHEWGVPAEDLTHHDRSVEWFHKSGILCHGDLPNNSHTDHVPVGPIIAAMKGGHPDAAQADKKPPRTQHPGKQPTDDDGEPTYTVTVSVAGKDMKVLNKDGTDENWTVHPEEAKEYPDGHIHLHRVDAAVAWAEANKLPLVKVLKYTPEKHPDHKDKGPDHQGGTKPGGKGHLTLRPGAHWPTDKRTVERLKKVAEDLGVEVRIISGLRTYAEQAELYRLYQAGKGNLAARPGTSNHEKGHAADTNVVTPKGLVSIGNYSGARQALKKHDLVLSVRTEAWHVDPKEVAPWANPPIP